jgi:Eukaryotic initiation factor 4E
MCRSGGEVSDAPAYEALEDVTGGSQTPIQNRYCFWYKQKGSKQTTTEDYESSIKQLASFQTVEHFWRIYNHLQRADQVPIGTVSTPKEKSLLVDLKRLLTNHMLHKHHQPPLWLAMLTVAAPTQ